MCAEVPLQAMKTNIICVISQLFWHSLGRDLAFASLQIVCLAFCSSVFACAFWVWLCCQTTQDSACLVISSDQSICNSTICYLFGVIVWVKVVFRKTVVTDISHLTQMTTTQECQSRTAVYLKTNWYPWVQTILQSAIILLVSYAHHCYYYISKLLPWLYAHHLPNMKSCPLSYKPIWL